MDKQQVSVNVPFREEISRLFIFRFFMVFVLIFTAWLIGIWLGIVMFLQFWYMLILGKRNKYLWEQQSRAYVWGCEWKAYLEYLEDKRPSFWW